MRRVNSRYQASEPQNLGYDKFTYKVGHVGTSIVTYLKVDNIKSFWLPPRTSSANKSCGGITGDLDADIRALVSLPTCDDIARDYCHQQFVVFKHSNYIRVGVLLVP